MTGPLQLLLRAENVGLLDGATGTELERLGYATRLPLWTADAALQVPDLLEGIHRAYLEAGADIVTANTFRSTAYTLRTTGRAAEAEALTARTVDVARAACRAAGHGLVAGCMAPLEDCYHPERVPSPEVLRHEHAAHARNLAAAGVDLLLVETMGTLREAQAAAEAALTTGLPVLLSFILDPSGSGDLLSGENLEAAAAAVRALDVGGRHIDGLLVNCSPRAVTLAALDRLRQAGDNGILGAYANLGHADGARGWEWDAEAAPEAFATWGRAARDRGARLLGGCCGTTPAHLRALARVLGRDI